MLSTKEISELWGISERMVRRFCVDGRIPEAKLENTNWFIPEGTPKPKRKPKTPIDESRKILTAFAKKVVYQRTKNNHYGIYEYIQVNLTYSSNRMASNRLTRNEVEEVYRTNKITTSFEPVKVDDIIETINHFAAVRYIVDNISAPLTQTFLKKLHHILTYGTYADRKENLHPGEYRTSTSKIGVKPKEISSKLATIIKNYESGAVNLEKILDFHVRLEKIRPFVDYNGRLGRLLKLHKGQIVTVVYYGIYEQIYLQLTGPVKKVDSYWRNLQIGNTIIDFPEIDQLLIDNPEAQFVNT